MTLAERAAGRIRIAIVMGTVLATGLASAQPGTPPWAETRWLLQLFGGTAFSAPSTLTVTTDALGTIEHDARWETRPLDQPFYWTLRARWQRLDDGVELQLIHHKIYLTNPTDVIEHAEVTHGFNILTANYLRRLAPLVVRGGLGVVIPDAEAVVDGVYRTSDRYSIAGPALILGAGWEHWFNRHVMLGADVQGSLGWADMDVGDMTMEVRNLALHLMVGVGVGF